MNPRELVKAAASLDPKRMRSLIEDAIAAVPFGTLVDTWLPESLHRLGEAWETGELTVAQEHFASAALMRAIGAVFEAAPPPSIPGTVAVGLPPGAHHEVSSSPSPPACVVSAWTPFTAAQMCLRNRGRGRWRVSSRRPPSWP